MPKPKKMQLICEVDMVERPQRSHSNIYKTACGARKAVITVAREGSDQSRYPKISMVISTANNRIGPDSKYMLSDNIIRMNSRFEEAGKGTIGLAYPALDILISKADPVQLKELLWALYLLERGEDIGSYFPAGSTQSLPAWQTSMEIGSQEEYSFTTSFPHTLNKLKINGSTMECLDPRILDLRHLQTLNLANNLLTTLPDHPGRWTCLAELDLSYNQLSEVPSVLYSSCVKNSLLKLKLNNNNLTMLPPQLCQLKRLVKLHVDDNRLSALPPNIGALTRLTYLLAKRNFITRVPSSITQLCLKELDLYGNPIEQLTDRMQMLSSNLGVPSLREIAARLIRIKGMTYREDEVPCELKDYLNSGSQCWCGRYCFESCARFLRKSDLTKLFWNVHAWDGRDNRSVPVEALLCSTACLQKFQKYKYSFRCFFYSSSLKYRTNEPEDPKD